MTKNPKVSLKTPQMKTHWWKKTHKMNLRLSEVKQLNVYLENNIN